MIVRTDLKKLREKSPLVHIISNGVTKERVADAALAIGASPMMAEYSLEVSEITEKAKTLVLNLGMLNEDKIKSIKISAEVANKMGIPIVLDPVGVGSSKIRRDLVDFLLKNFKFSVIRGNFSEINYLVNGEVAVGVDSLDSGICEDDFKNVAIKLSEMTGAVVVVSGKYEIIASVSSVISIPGGGDVLRKITGLGDIESAIIGSLLAKPVSNVKACVIAGVFLRQIAVKLEDGGSIDVSKIIIELQKLDFIEGEVYDSSFLSSFDSKILYGISDGEDISKIKSAIDGGMKIYQLRDKNGSDDVLDKKINDIKKIIDDRCVFVVNDRLDLAKKHNVSLHLGQDDGSVEDARALLSRDKIIGSTAKTLELAIEAENMGANYIGTGAFFDTETKKDAKKISLNTLEEIMDGVYIPVYPIGGINLNNLDFFDGIVIDGVCMSSGIFANEANKIELETKKIIQKLKNL